MRRVLILIIFGCVPYMGYGASDFDTAEQLEIVSSVRTNMNVIRSSDAQEIRDFIKNEDSEFINEISGLDEQEQIGQMRNWLAKQTFNFYYHKYMDEIQSQSEKTGRQIKMAKYKYDEKSNFGTTYYWWLDRGELDESKCEQDLIKQQACDYPDGFEEYAMSYETIVAKDRNDVMAQLIIMKDDIATNSHTFIKITLTIEKWDNSVEAKGIHMVVDAGGTTEKYTDYYQWRNQEMADIRAGKYRKPTKEEQAEWAAKYKGSPFSDRLAIVTDETRDWASNYLPDVAVAEIISDYSHQIIKNKK